MLVAIKTAPSCKRNGISAEIRKLEKVSYQSGFKVKSDFGQFRVAVEMTMKRINLVQLPDSGSFMALFSSVDVNKKPVFLQAFI